MQRRMQTAHRVLAIALGVALSGCPGSPCPSAENPNSCTCPEKESCSLDCAQRSGCSFTCSKTNETCSVTCGDQCTSLCQGAKTCTTRCGTGCIVACQGTGRCDAEVRAGGNVKCDQSTSCDVRCAGSCEVSCLEGNCRVDCGNPATCNVRCNKATDGGLAPLCPDGRTKVCGRECT
jgi:hypothetical protein